MKNLAISFVILFLLSLSLHAATLLHHYDFSSSGVTDLVGGANGTLLNGANVSGGTLDLDGVNDFVQFDQALIPASSSFSVTLFARQDSQQNKHVELISQGFSGCCGFYIGHNPSQIIRVGDQFTNTGVPFPLDNQMHHYAVVSDRGKNTTSLYIDGTLQFTGEVAFPDILSGSNTALGTQFQGINEFFHGSLDDVRIFSGALTNSEIANIATGNLVPELSSHFLLITALLVICMGKKRMS